MAKRRMHIEAANEVLRNINFDRPYFG